VLTLHRPHALNALSAALRAELVAALQALDRDDTVRAVVLTGAGKAFCAGLDLRELGTEGVPTLGGANDPVRAIIAFSKPLIAAVNGAAVTGGFELALACDVLLASTSARFADTHARIGVIPGWGLSQKLSRLIGLPRAKEMAFSGNFINADTAERWGIANRVLSPDELLPAALALAADMASAEPGMLRAYKRLIDEGFGLPLGEAMVLEAQRSKEWAAAQTPEALERRRAAVQERGRGQVG
jgi:enoyl-CoA hydratase